MKAAVSVTVTYIRNIQHVFTLELCAPSSGNKKRSPGICEVRSADKTIKLSLSRHLYTTFAKVAPLT